MNEYFVIKDNDVLGPFSLTDIKEFLENGIILKRDKIVINDDTEHIITAGQLMKDNNIYFKIESKGTLVTQIKELGTKFLLPPTAFSVKPWHENRKLMILALVGISMSVVLALIGSLSLLAIFYIIALYFSALWGLFFHYLFKTEQIRTGISILIFFATQLVIIIIYGSELGSIFGDLADSPNPVTSLFGYIVGVGGLEETIKLIPIVWVLFKSKDVLKPQTMVYYGLISGVAFGVFEGVQYQMGYNLKLLLNAENIMEGYTYSFLLNISRLTSLPFLHAVWCGIGSYFLASAFMFPRYRISLVTLAILIPAALHGIYDFCCGRFNFMHLIIVFFSVSLLMVYLSNREEFHNRLEDL